MEGAELKRLKLHIFRQYLKGHKLQTVKDSLISSGFSKSEVNKAIESLAQENKIQVEKKPIFSGLLKGITPNKKTKPASKESSPEKQKLFKKEKPEMPEIKPKPIKIREEKPRRLWIFGFLAVLLIVVVVFGLAYVAPTKCTTEDCFTSKANKCLAATFKNQIEGTTVYYETNNCVLTKTIQALDPNEPQEIVDAFLGKSMTCKFNKNDFSPLFLNSITGYLEACEGPLKDKILEIARQV